MLSYEIYNEMNLSLWWEGSIKQYFVWDRVNNPTITIKLKTPGSSAEHFSVTGEVTPFSAFDGTTLKDIQLTAGNVEIFRINP